MIQLWQFVERHADALCNLKIARLIERDVEPASAACAQAEKDLRAALEPVEPAWERFAERVRWIDAFTKDRCACVFETSLVCKWVTDLLRGRPYIPGPGADTDETALAGQLQKIGRTIGYGRAQQILGEQWEADHDCAPRGRMGVTVRDEVPR